MPTLFILEANEALGRLAKFTLELEGYHVRWFRNGRDGLAALYEDPPDLLMLDLAMPGFTGWDVLRTIDADSTLRQIPVVVITALADADREAAQALGVKRFLVKPIGVGQLVGVVKEMVGAP